VFRNPGRPGRSGETRQGVPAHNAVPVRKSEESRRSSVGRQRSTATEARLSSVT
jgi:hypothetical protein